MRFLERTAERLQLENDNLKAELVERDQKYQELMADFEMTEDFRCQVEEENNRLRKQLEEVQTDLEDQIDVTHEYHEMNKEKEREIALLKAQVTNLTNLLEEALDNLEEAVNENDRLEAEKYDLKCDLCEAKTDLAGLQLNSNNLVIKQLVQSLKAAGIIPQQTEVKL